jgi:hypothetical protein
MTERGVQLRHRLQGQDGTQETHEIARAGRVDLEVGVREAEDDAHVVLVEEHRVDAQAGGLMDEGEDEGRHSFPAAQAADAVGPLVAVEDRRQDLDGVERRPVGVAGDVAVERPRHGGDLAVEISPQRGVRALAQDRTHERRGRGVARVAQHHRRAHRLGADGRGRADDLDLGIDADGREDPAADRVVEGLQELRIGVLSEAVRKGGTHAPPVAGGGRRVADIADGAPHGRQSLPDGPAVEVEPDPGVLLAGPPVSRFEAQARQAGLFAEPLQVALESPMNRLGDEFVHGEKPSGRGGSGGLPRR